MALHIGILATRITTLNVDISQMTEFCVMDIASSLA